jgi:hypothetical protein
MSLSLWINDVKMSPKKDKSVPQLIEKYKQQYPAFERSELRHMIRIDNPLLFNQEKNSSYQSNLKKLDRYLKKEFDNPKPTTKPISGYPYVTINGKEAHAKRCPACNKIISPEDNFCPYCASSVKEKNEFDLLGEEIRRIMQNKEGVEKTASPVKEKNEFDLLGEEIQRMQKRHPDFNFETGHWK